MTHLHHAAAWTIDEPERPREYVVHHDGRLLANVTRVPVPRADSGIMPYPDPHMMYDQTRVVVCATAPDGTRLFYLDQTHDLMRPAPSYVLAPDGSRLGSIEVRAFKLKGPRGVINGLGGAMYAVLDARGEVVAGLAFPPVQNPEAEGLIADPANTELGRFNVERSPHDDRRRRYCIRLHGPVPEPLRTLLPAALIGVELMIPVDPWLG